METVVRYPYPVEVRQVDVGNGWQWEAKIEEIGLLVYSPSKDEAFKTVMQQYEKWLKKNNESGEADK